MKAQAQGIVVSGKQKIDARGDRDAAREVCGVMHRNFAPPNTTSIMDDRLEILTRTCVSFARSTTNTLSEETLQNHLQIVRSWDFPLLIYASIFRDE